MIVSHINNFEKEQGFFSPILQKGLRYLINTDFSKVSNGRHVICGDDMFAIISEYSPEDKEKRKPETHEKYIDIQYIISGEEIMGYKNFSQASMVLEDHLIEKDIVFYKGIDNESEIKLQQGMFAIFFPWDIHRPGCISKTDIEVRKVVLKIKI